MNQSLILTQKNVLIRVKFFDFLKQPAGFDAYLRGMAQQPAQQKGAGVASELTKNWLRGPMDAAGIDLVALAIQVRKNGG